MAIGTRPSSRSSLCKSLSLGKAFPCGILPGEAYPPCPLSSHQSQRTESAYNIQLVSLSTLRPKGCGGGKKAVWAAEPLSRVQGMRHAACGSEQPAQLVHGGDAETLQPPSSRSWLSSRVPRRQQRTSSPCHRKPGPTAPGGFLNSIRAPRSRDLRAAPRKRLFLYPT